MEPKTFYCWPVHWMVAAVNAGLAVKTEDGIQIVGGDEMREKLATFAEQVMKGPK